MSIPDASKFWPSAIEAAGPIRCVLAAASGIASLTETLWIPAVARPFARHDAHSASPRKALNEPVVFTHTATLEHTVVPKAGIEIFQATAGNNFSIACVTWPGWNINRPGAVWVWRNNWRSHNRGRPRAWRYHWRGRVVLFVEKDVCQNTRGNKPK